MIAALLLPVIAQAAQPASSLAGPWSGAIHVPGMELQIFVELKAGAPWSGTLSIPEQKLKDYALADVKVDLSSVAFRMPGIPGDPAFQGTLQADGSLKGTFIQGGQSFPFSLARGGAAPAQPQNPEDREVGFSGFNGFPLKGSVRAAEGGAYFAVMVAGSGPTDRDWSNPLLRDPRTGRIMPSHGGRDFAAWLAQRGIGSLRYDKRFIGSRDPKLDISLDAQSGDIRAALGYARALPEARGKKLLLVGHSEGALLSLLQAGGSDALMLLAMPSSTMARTIRQQIEVQLPFDKSAANLAYLDSAFAAIRAGKPTPAGGPDVFPQIVDLAKSLMRPESLGFVRDTLDLDPWTLAARVSVPVAVAWGDRDMQTWKPATLPASFPGTVIEIREANHLFKRESRPRSELNGANAAYGDDTPMADLAPIEVWLKSLK